jgi:predicted RNase H-like HicB family nuclease
MRGLGNKEDGGARMIDLEYSLTIEATKEPDFFGFYSPDLPGFSGVGHSVEDCLYKAKWGMIEHVNLLKQQGLPVPPKNVNPKIIIQNEESLKAAWKLVIRPLTQAKRLTKSV